VEGYVGGVIVGSQTADHLEVVSERSRVVSGRAIAPDDASSRPRRQVLVLALVLVPLNKTKDVPKMIEMRRGSVRETVHVAVVVVATRLKKSIT
jgi:hypothetical protein